MSEQIQLVTSFTPQQRVNTAINIMCVTTILGTLLADECMERNWDIYKEQTSRNKLLSSVLTGTVFGSFTALFVDRYNRKLF